MNQVAVNNLEHGMVLSADVLDINDRLLLAKGQKIESRHLRVLKIWGVAQVSVVGGNSAVQIEQAQTDTAKAVAVRDSLDSLFQNIKIQHSSIQELYRCAFLYRYRNNDWKPRRVPTQDLQNQTKTVFPKNLAQQLQRIDAKLPDAPSIVMELNDLVADPYTTSNDIARVVSKSPSLASLILKMVNSSFYGFSAKIDQISRAVTMIGNKEISNLAIGICVLKQFSDIDPEILDLNSFVTHSYATGLIARILAAWLNIPQTERLFVTGLLHDVGKLVIYKYFPKHALAIFSRAQHFCKSVYHAEEGILGRCHTWFARELLRKWHLPAALQEAVAFHHAPNKAEDRIAAALVQMADLIVNAMGWGRSGEFSPVGFDGDLWNQIGIPNSVLPVAIRQAQHQLDAMLIAVNIR